MEVEPGYAPTGQLASVVMATYGQHTSVVGFGISVAHNGVSTASDGSSLSDTAASYVLGLVQAVNPSAQLYLRGSLTSMMPAATRDGLVFVDDKSGFRSQAEQLTSMQSWATNFAPAQVAYAIGAAADASWWCTTDNAHAAANLVAGLLTTPPSNLTAIYWSADSLDAVFPTQACSTLSASANSTTTATTAPATTTMGTAAEFAPATTTTGTQATTTTTTTTGQSTAATTGTQTTQSRETGGATTATTTGTTTQATAGSTAGA